MQGKPVLSILESSLLKSPCSNKSWASANLDNKQTSQECTTLSQISVSC